MAKAKKETPVTKVTVSKKKKNIEVVVDAPKVDVEVVKEDDTTTVEVTTDLSLLGKVAKFLSNVFGKKK